MSSDSLLALALAEEDAYLATLEALVALESPTRDKALCDRLADHLATVLAGDGWDLAREARTDAGDVLVARLGPKAGPATLLLCHYDTVWPAGTLAAMPFRRDGERVHGPGALDMKAGIATAIHAARLLRRASARLRGPVTLLVTSDEETGSHHSRELIERLAERHQRVLVLEPGRDDAALKVGRKGVGQVRLRLTGRSAHAGNNPEDGASALRELAHLLLYVEDLGDPDAGTTVNLTVARGGSTGNVIAEEASAEVDLRVLRAAEADRVLDALAAYEPRDPRVTVEVAGGLNRPPLERTDGNTALWDEARRLGAALGLRLEGAVVGGGSDGSFTSAKGVPTLDGLGSVGAGPHARHEHIRVRPTLERLALVAALIAGDGTGS
ncbi:MAG: M20 family metallopeptidase [Deinococcales bacterium]